MTVCELRELLKDRGPNREVFVSVHPGSHVVRQLYPLVGLGTDGEAVLLEAVEAPVEGAGQ